MVCVTLQPYVRVCGLVSGSVVDVLLFDPQDLNFTKTTTAGVDAYTAVAASTDADADANALAFRVNFLPDTAERTWKQSVTGCSVSYDHEVHAQLVQLSKELQAFLSSLDAAGCCCGLGVIVRHGDGKIFILGESLVGGVEIIPWRMKNDGSDGGTGKTFSDFNGVNLVLKGKYNREAIEYTGTWATLTAFLTAGA